MAEGRDLGAGIRSRSVAPSRAQADLPRRGLGREASAIYIGVGATKFDQMVSDGRMPMPKRIDGRKVWDRAALDSAFEDLPSDQPANSWDDVIHGQG